MSIDHSMMRVLYLIDTLSVGGAEQSLASIVHRFRNTEAVVCHIYPGDYLQPAFASNDIRVVSLDLPGKYDMSQAIADVRRLIKELNPDLVHSTLLRSNLVARIAGRLTGVPVVNSFVSESYAPVRFDSLSPSLRRKFKAVQLADRLTAGLAYHFVANSHAIRLANSQALGIPLDKISVIYRGRDPQNFVDCNPGSTVKLRDELGLSDDTPVLLNVGRLVLAKNQITLVRSMPAILREAPACHLLIAGEGPERHALETTIADLDLNQHVHLLGNRPDIAALLHIADVFVFPSLYEGHPGALVEAMFAARPIVASDIPVHRETLLNGAVGELTTLDNTSALAQRVISLLRNPAHARNLGACARQSALQRFDIRRIAAQHEQLYQALVERWGAAH